MAFLDVNLYKDFIREDTNNPYFKQLLMQSGNKTQINSATKTVTSQPNANLKNIEDDSFIKIEENFKNTKKNRGLFEKFYDFCKNVTGFGQGYKKTEEQIKLAKDKKIPINNLEQSVEKYKKSTENARQLFGDTLSSLASIGALFGVTNLLETLKAQYATGATNSMGVKAIDFLTSDIVKELGTGKFKFFANILQKIGNGLKKVATGNKRGKILLALPAAMLTGGLVKYWTLKLNRIGSNEFSIKSKKELGKEEYKKQKKAMNKTKRAQSFKNFWTGMLNGLLSPITMLGGGLIGAPAYVASLFGTRYMTSDNDKKSLSNFGKTLTDNVVINSLAALAVAIPAFKTARFSNVLSKNLNTIMKELKAENLISSDVQKATTALDEMKGIMYKSENVSKIVGDYNLPVDEQIRKLIDENIFAVKFLQTDNGSFSKITRALKENCPSTRTLEEAQKDINTLLGNTNYQVSKCLGVGTVAETYLAKDNTGKEVAVKILKKGISAEKIMQDKEKLLKLITGGVADSQLNEHQKYLVRNLDDLASNILKEVNLENEAKAATELAKFTKRADIVKPLFVKNGVYVMEKANGISVSALHNYAEASMELKCAKKLLAKNPTDANCIKAIKELEEKIAKIKSKSPSFADFDITPEQIKKMTKAYIDVMTEQFVKLDKNGKMIHGDIHPGNIFIDLDVLKGSKKGKLFTLIDTGNTINVTKEQVKDSLKMMAFIKNGNYKDIARIATENSILPTGLSRDDARNFVEAELKKYFTDTTHKLKPMTMESLYSLTDAIQAQKGIIPNNTQLTLNKSKNSAMESLSDLLKSFGKMKFGNIDIDEENHVEIAKTIAIATKDMASIGAKMAASNKLQETKNLFKMSPKELWSFIKNKNMLPLNSKEHLIYGLKQNMPGELGTTILDNLG